MSQEPLLDDIINDSLSEHDNVEAAATPTKTLFYQDSEEEEEGADAEKASHAIKQVRFRNQGQPSSEANPPQPWQFKTVIKNEYRRKLPNNYEIKYWKKPTPRMLNAVVQLLENNVEDAIEHVFSRYQDEIQAVVRRDPQKVSKIRQQKKYMMRDIVSKIQQRLQKAKFPSRVPDRDMDIEYIFAKRKFIQDRYALELSNAERIETELIKEQNTLESTREMCKTLKETNKHLLKEELVMGNLHPSLNRAVQNAYGLLNDNNDANFQNRVAFQKDVHAWNLKADTIDYLQQTSVLKNNSKEDIENAKFLLPSLEKHEKVSRELANNIASLLKSTELQR